MVNILVYFTVFLVVLTIFLLTLSSIKGMMNSKGNLKKMLLKIPILICVAPCLIILGTSLYNMLLMMFGSESMITIASDLEDLCCTAGTWISGFLIGFGILVILMGTIFKLIKRRSLT